MQKDVVKDRAYYIALVNSWFCSVHPATQALEYYYEMRKRG